MDPRTINEELEAPTIKKVFEDLAVVRDRKSNIYSVVNSSFKEVG